MVTKTWKCIKIYTPYYSILNLETINHVSVIAIQKKQLSNCISVRVFVFKIVIKAVFV